MGRSVNDDLIKLATAVGWIVIGALGWLLNDKFAHLANQVSKNGELGHTSEKRLERLEERISGVDQRTKFALDAFQFCTQINENQREDSKRLLELEKTISYQRR